MKKLMFLLMLYGLLIANSVYADINFSITLTSDILLREDQVCGDGNVITAPRSYLSEGEQIIFNVSVEDSSAIEDIDDVYVTVNDVIAVECLSSGNVSPTIENYHCVLTIETPESMYGESIIKAKATSIYGEEANIYIGNWFLNSVPEITSSTTSLLFPDAYGGETVYSDWINISNNAEGNVTLNIKISGTDFYDSTSSGAKCPITNQLNLSNLAYYAKNGIYNTSTDPGADEEGYISIPYVDYSVYNQFQELIFGHSSINNDENINLKFRLNVPSFCRGNFDTGEVLIWGWIESRTCPEVGIELNFNFQTIPANCYRDSDCEDFNPNTKDACVNASSRESYCRNDINKRNITIKVGLKGRGINSSNVTIEVKSPTVCTIYSVLTNASGEAIINDLDYGIYNMTAKPYYYLRNAVNNVVVDVNNAYVDFGASKNGDLYNDNRVNMRDLAMFSYSYGSNCTSSYYRWYSDFNGDCQVNSLDIPAFSTAYGSVGIAGLC